MLERVRLATQQTGKEGLVTLLSEDPSQVKQIISNLCREEHLLHNACLLGDDELVMFLTGGNYIDINKRSPLVTFLHCYLHLFPLVGLSL